MKAGTYLLAMAAFGLLSIAPGLAAPQLSPQDRNFIIKAAQGGTTEVQLGQLAVSKRDGRRVQQFGQRMIQQHSGANNKLMTLAANVGVALPMDPRQAMGAHGRALYDQLAGLRGDQFARAYMADMVQDHIKTIALFRREAEYGHDPQLRAFARDMLPVIEEHLAIAEPLYAEVSGSPTRIYAHRRMNGM